MKSYKDKQLLFRLLFLSLAAGATGHFFETEHFSFPGAGNLNQAAAILATQENIVGKPGLKAQPTITIAIGERDTDLAHVSPAPDISFSRTTDCASDTTIKTAHDKTVGFLCLDAKDPNFDAKIRSVATMVNELIVSPNFGSKAEAFQMTAISRGALADGAALIVGIGPKASTGVDAYNGLPIVYSLGELKTKEKDILVKATLTGTRITNVILDAK